MNATISALQYGIPLLSYAKLAFPFVSAGAINYFVHLTQPATPQETTVVLPNVDTLYSAAVFDLSSHDINVTIPSIDADRYWSFAFYDPFGDNFATPSSVVNNSAGNYLLRYTPDGSWGLQSSIEVEDCSPYQGYINSPTTNGVVLGRVLVKNNSTDLKYVQSLVNASALTTVPSNRSAPASLTKENLAPYHSNDTALAMMQLLANFDSTNPSFNISRKSEQELEVTLSKAGIQNGTYTQPGGVNLSEAYERVLSSIEAQTSDFTRPFNEGWTRTFPQGLYGDNYAARAAVAAGGYLELTSDQVLYPMRVTSTMNLSSNESYLHTFSSKPPVASDGFWSLTLYNSAGYLVENSLNRYAVGDRSNLTYSDGTPVYGNVSVAIEDRSFQILIQSAAITPPSNWTNNWLPSPANSSNFSATLRFYAPGPEFENGSYEFPIVAKQSAIIS